MKTLVVYDSYFGNTEKVAGAIKDALGSAEEVELQKIGEMSLGKLGGLEVLVIGSPTRGFRPTKAVLDFIKDIPEGGLSGVKVAGFDTRVSMEKVKSRFLKWMVNSFGYAAEPIADKLEKKGGIKAAEPGGFFVLDTEGPLEDGELDRAAEWARRIVE
jgi:flavodoxin